MKAIEMTFRGLYVTQRDYGQHRKLSANFDISIDFINSYSTHIEKKIIFNKLQEICGLGNDLKTSPYTSIAH